MNLPIASIYLTIQGEGPKTGTPTWFIRLAGCNVGRLTSPDAPAICTAWNGAEFDCDTDYRPTRTLKDPQEFLAGLNTYPAIKEVCITGGEPCIHPELFDVIRLLRNNNYTINIETSGTKVITPGIASLATIVCSPKQGFLAENIQRIQHYKFVVASCLDLQEVRSFIQTHNIDPNETQIWIQPLADGETIDSELSRRIALELLNHPWTSWNFKLSLQTHKLINLP